MPKIDLRCEGDETAGWACLVTIHERGRDLSRHRVRVAPTVLARLDPRALTPDALVRASFAFLLEREPPSAILRSFDLEEIGRYFPSWETEVRRSG